MWPLRAPSVVRLSITALFLIFSLLPVAAQKAPLPEAAAFQAWAARYDAKADDTPNSALLQEGINAARQRRAALRTLIETDPQAALAMSRALTHAERFPPEIRQELETAFATNGDYLVRGALAARGGPAVEPLHRFVRLGGRMYKAHVFGHRLGGVSQYNVPVSGITLDDVAALDETAATPSPELEQPNPPSAWTTGGKNVLIIRVDFSDLAGAPEGYSAATVQNIADTQIAPYYIKSSYGLTSLTNTVTATVYRLPQTAAYYAQNGANDTLHSDAENAASADYNVSSYDRIIVFFASLGGLSGSQITYGGLADIGGADVWCNGEFDFRVIAHELGHTYGLYHGNL